MHKRQIYKAHPRGWRTSLSRASSFRVYHTSHLVPVRRPACLDWASSRPHLTMTPLPFSLPSAPLIPGVRTFTSQALCHARHTRCTSGAAICRRLHGLVGLFLGYLLSSRIRLSRSDKFLQGVPQSILFVRSPCLQKQRRKPTWQRG
jgi:hypothetical protein